MKPTLLIVICFQVAIWRGNGQPSSVDAQTNSQSFVTLAEENLQKFSESQEQLLKERIDVIKARLQDRSLSEITRSNLVADLRYYEGVRAKHRVLLRMHQQALLREPATAEQALEAQTKATQAAFADLEKSLATARAERRQVQANHQTNVQLWANYADATRKRDPDLKAKAERELAEYLTKQLEWINGRTYPTNLSLDEVMKHYHNYPAEKSNSPPVLKASNRNGFEEGRLLCLD